MNKSTYHILVVDDDAKLRKLLCKYLDESGFMVTTAADAADARAKMKYLTFDMIVLDLMMPGESGIDLATHLRKSSSVPILMLTAMGEAEDRIAGLEHGADDYMAKPFEPRELILRINSILSRMPEHQDEGPTRVNMGDVVFDLERDELSCGGELIRLTEVEVALLKTLAERSGRILSREELTLLTGASGGERAVDVQVTRLRRKIELDPKLPRYLKTVRGKGYVLHPD